MGKDPTNPMPRVVAAVQDARCRAVAPAPLAQHELMEAASFLCWLVLEHAGCSEPEDIEAVRRVERALLALGWTGPTYAPAPDEEG